MGIYGMGHAYRARYQFGVPAVSRPLKMMVGAPAVCRPVPEPRVITPIFVTPAPAHKPCGSTGTLLAGLAGFSFGALVGSLIR